MTKKSLFSFRKTPVLNLLLITMTFLSIQGVSAQSLPDFSGTWLQDITKSDDFYKEFNVKCTITQNSQTFNVKTTFSDKSGNELAVRESTFTLNGKETVSSEGAKLSAKWSPDKKSLTTSETKDYGGDLVGVTATYSISDGGLLTVKTSDIKPDVKSITQVFTRSGK